ncbi:unnamed protein product [Adineta ricciae]|uniref:Uncharacterized protein n=1 Tax=Adineta ricciae TaxID=249248 RepID=A0A815CZ56_ADIRI|nr:unnamed protein product [Adineta ricciae]
MEILLILAVLIRLSIVDGLLCLSPLNQTIMMSMKNLSRENLNVALNKISQSEFKSPCRASLIAVPGADKIQFLFTDMLQQERMSIDSIKFVTTVHYYGIDRGIVLNLVQTACSYRDICDKEFILNHFEWLIQFPSDDIFTTNAPLLYKDSNPVGLCSGVNNTIRQCPNAMCAIEWRTDGTSFNEGCIETPNALLQILTSINITTTQETTAVIIACNYDECNSRKTISKIQANIKQYYDISPLHRALFISNKSLEATTTTTVLTTFTNSITSTQMTPIILPSSVISSTTTDASTSTSNNLSTTRSSTTTTTSTTTTHTSNTTPKNCFSERQWKNTMLTTKRL